MHDQFCAIAKKHELNDSNFDNFARDYLKNNFEESSSSSSGGSVGIKFVSFSGSHSQSKSKKSMSEAEKLNHLKKSKKEILDYYTSNCGDRSYEQSLQAQATHLSKIANSNVVAALARMYATETPKWTFC